MPPQIYGFGSFQLNIVERQLTCRGRVIRLHAKVFDTLVALIHDAGRLLRKDALMKAIWPDHVVEENNLQHNICVLRRVLQQHEAQSFIETVPGHGYRFSAEVQILERAVPMEVPALRRNAPALVGARLRSAPRPVEFSRGQAANSSRSWSANRADGDSLSLTQPDQLAALLQRFDELRHAFRELGRELADIEQHLQHSGLLRADRQLRP